MPLFAVSDVEYRYEDGTPAIDSVSLDIEVGEHMAVLGANGSGKSTLLRLLGGLLFPTAGTVRFSGTELSERVLHQPKFRQEFRQQVGFVFQNADAQLFNATVFEEVAFGPNQLGLSQQEVADRTNEVLVFLGIQHLAERPPFRLSGGEKRKVAIASVLSMNPSVILMDEPFLGLDPRSQTWLIKTLQQLQTAGKTTIIATHTLDTVARVAERVVVLSEEHKVRASGATDAILNDLQLLQDTNLSG